MGLEQKIWANFTGGRYTRRNLLNISSDHVLIAKDIILTGDGVPHKRPGYTLVKALGWEARKIFDFRRQSDFRQLIMLAGSGKLAYMNADGTGYTVLSSTEDANAIFDFQTNVFAAYCSNGIASWRLVDVNGTLTKWQWGISAPVAAPTVSIGSGTLNLTYGRQYVYCYVSKWTDSTGVARLNIGPPSPTSAGTGPVTDGLVTVASLTASTDPQVTHIWVFSTNDTPTDTTSALLFAAEITNGTTSWGDDQPDTSLDPTRLAPYENYPAPLGTILAQFAQNIIMGGIAGHPDLVQISGLGETTLGIPQETFPLDMFFSVPGGIKAITGMIVFNQTLMLSTQDFWFQISGNSAQTFQEQDNIFAPGACGPRCICILGGWMLWLGIDKKLWAWNGSSEPVEISWKIARRDGGGMLSMEDMNAEQLASAELRAYSFGRYQLLALFVNTSENPSTYLDWVQLWDVSVLSGPAGPFGQMTEDGRLQTSAESDMFPSHAIVASANVLVDEFQYLFIADVTGNVYRWPDGYQDAGVSVWPVLGSEYSDLTASTEPPADALKRMRTLDAKTTRSDALQAFQVMAAATDGANFAKALVPVPTRQLPAPVPDPTCLRAYLEHSRNASFGRLLRWAIAFPGDANDAGLYQVVVKYSPISER